MTIEMTGVFEASHGEEAFGDGRALAALFRTDAGLGAGGVDEGDDRDAEFLGVFHEALGFAVALGTGHTEVAAQVFAGIATFLMADDHHGAAIEPGEAADERFVIPEAAVAMQLDEAGHELVDIGEGVGRAGWRASLTRSQAVRGASGSRSATSTTTSSWGSAARSRRDRLIGPLRSARRAG